jgi:hypothetical protein
MLCYFILGYLQLYEVIINYFLLLKVISPYDIIGYSRLYYYRLLVVILLVAINGYWLFFYW